MAGQKAQEDYIGTENKSGDRKGESNDSPEIPDKGKTSKTKRGHQTPLSISLRFSNLNITVLSSDILYI